MTVLEVFLLYENDLESLNSTNLMFFDLLNSIFFFLCFWLCAFWLHSRLLLSSRLAPAFPGHPLTTRSICRAHPRLPSASSADPAAPPPAAHNTHKGNFRGIWEQCQESNKSDAERTAIIFPEMECNANTLWLGKASLIILPSCHATGGRSRRAAMR